ncbi:MAG: DUF2442 domain-containing protein [Saprospiraceae bacterium]
MNLIRVIQAEYLERFKIKLRFNDGTNGIVDLEKELYGQVFEPLKDLEFFRNFTLDTWTICWPNGADFSPEFLHELVLKNHLELAKN